MARFIDIRFRVRGGCFRVVVIHVSGVVSEVDHLVQPTAVVGAPRPAMDVAGHIFAVETAEAVVVPCEGHDVLEGPLAPEVGPLAQV